MKKLFVLGIAMLLSVCSFAQSMNVQTAYNYMRKSKFKDALEAIQPALEHPQTVGQAKTWFYYGNIAFELANNPDYAGVLPGALDEAVRAYAKAAELDKRGEYTDDITRFTYSISESYFGKGVDNYNNKLYEEAANDFMKTYAMREGMGRIDTAALENAGRSWMAAENWNQAETAFKKLNDMNWNDSYAYVSLAKIAIANKNVNQAAAYLEEGEKKFPTDPVLLTEKANLYLTTELAELNKDEAMNTLQKLISLDPQNHLLYYNVGVTYAADSSKFDEAVESYKKAIELKPDYANAYFNLSSLYLEKANIYVRQANELPIEEEQAYGELVEKSKEMLEEALPYVEKAHELDPDDKAVVQILKEIYAKLNMKEKLDALNK